MRSKMREQTAAKAAEVIRSRLGVGKEIVPVGMVLGTGWGDVLALENERTVEFKELPGFERLGTLEGHHRRVCYGRLNGRPVVALRGRVHLNESHDPDHGKMVRLQLEMLLQLGVQTVILTCAAGSLTRRDAGGETSAITVHAGDIVLIDGFVTVFAPKMPLEAGEFCSPEDAIDQALLKRILDVSTAGPLRVRCGGYAMLAGPFFEGRRYDKPLLASTGANVVGMSVLPEACVASLYEKEGVKILPLAFVTNSDTEVHSHETNLARAKKTASDLGALLTSIVANVPRS